MYKFRSTCVIYGTFGDRSPQMSYWNSSMFLRRNDTLKVAIHSVLLSIFEFRRSTLRQGVTSYSETGN